MKNRFTVLAGAIILSIPALAGFETDYSASLTGAEIRAIVNSGEKTFKHSDRTYRIIGSPCASENILELVGDAGVIHAHTNFGFPGIYQFFRDGGGYIDPITNEIHEGISGVIDLSVEEVKADSAPKADSKADAPTAPSVPIHAGDVQTQVGAENKSESQARRNVFEKITIGDDIVLICPWNLEFTELSGADFGPAPSAPLLPDGKVPVADGN